MNNNERSLLDTPLGPGPTNLEPVIPDSALALSCNGTKIDSKEAEIVDLLLQHYESDKEKDALRKENRNLAYENDIQRRGHALSKRIAAVAMIVIIGASAKIAYDFGKDADSEYLTDAIKPYSDIVSDNTHRTGESKEYYWYDADGIVEELRDRNLSGPELDLAIYGIYKDVDFYEGGSGEQVVSRVIADLTDGEYSDMKDYTDKKFGLDLGDADFADKYEETITSLAKSNALTNPIANNGKGAK